MALVAYDNSDSSEFEDDEITESLPVDKPLLEDNVVNKVEVVSEANHSLFNLLPQPSKTRPQVFEEDDEFLHKKPIVASNAVKPKARITVPSLSDFKDVDSSSAKRKTPSTKKSGLLSMLPQPKSEISRTKAKQLIPHVLTRKPTVKQKASTVLDNKQKGLNIEYSDESDNDDIETDFFSINKKEEPLEELPQVMPVEESLPSDHQVASGIEKYFKKDPVSNGYLNDGTNDLVTDSYVNDTSYNSEVHNQNDNQNAYEGTSNEIQLDDEAIRQLCGSRGKRKREEIQILNVNQEEVLADAREWMVKGLMDDTSKRVSASKKKGNDFTNQQKRKHQITYLAHQAKANEVELQNQWANNRMSKRQTQSKYGF